MPDDKHLVGMVVDLVSATEGVIKSRSFDSLGIASPFYNTLVLER